MTKTLKWTIIILACIFLSGYLFNHFNAWAGIGAAVVMLLGIVYMVDKTT